MFDDKANYTFSARQSSRKISIAPSMDSLLSLPADVAEDDKINFHDLSLPRELDKDMLRLTSRLMPEPVLQYERHFLEPLTSVFADF